MVFAPVDICFLIIILIFAVLAMIKGLIKEFFGKMSVFGGLACAIIFSPKLTPFVENTIHNTIISAVLSFLLIFVVVFLIICIIQQRVDKLFSGEIMRGLDRILGFLLGVLEGLVVVLFIMVVMTVQPWFNIDNIVSGSLFFSVLSGVINSSAEYVKGMAANV